MEDRITPVRMQELLDCTFGKENIKVVNYRKYNKDRTSFEIHSESADGKIAEIIPYSIGTVFFDGLWELSIIGIGDRWVITIKPDDIMESTEEDFFKIFKEICDELVETILTRRRFTKRIQLLKEDPTAEIRAQRLKGLL